MLGQFRDIDAKPDIFTGWLITISSTIAVISLSDSNYKPGTVPSISSPSIIFLSTILFFYGFGSALVSVCIAA
jgi:hypothetical protein